MKQSKLSYLPDEYVVKNEILECNCKNQVCCGKFLKIKPWQKVCQWECIRLGIATDMSLNKTKNMLKLEDVKPFINNSKEHSEAQIKMIAESIIRFGWRQNIMVNHEDGTIIAGHGRFLAWESKKDIMKEPWIVDDAGNTISGEPETKPFTTEEELAYRELDNLIQQLTKPDFIKVEENIEFIKDEEVKQLVDEVILLGSDEKPIEPVGESELVRFNANPSGNPFVIKATFKQKEDLENCLDEIDPIVAKYKGSNVTVSGND